MTAHSSLIGEGVTFYFYGPNTSLNMHSFSNIDATASTTGNYAGFIFVQHAGSSPGQSSVVAGGGVVRIVGMAYFPTQVVDIRGESDFNIESPYMAIVADSFRIRGNGMFTVRANPELAGYEDQMARVMDGARLIK